MHGQEYCFYFFFWLEACELQIIPSAFASCYPRCKLLIRVRHHKFLNQQILYRIGKLCMVKIMRFAAGRYYPSLSCMLVLDGSNVGIGCTVFLLLVPESAISLPHQCSLLLQLIHQYLSTAEEVYR